jgi:ferredoxin
MKTRISGPTPRLRVDWPACRARGLCFELLPEAITLDDWGYPVVGELDPSLVTAARDAVKACPTLALRLVTPPDPRRAGHLQ